MPPRTQRWTHTAGHLHPLPSDDRVRDHQSSARPAPRSVSAARYKGHAPLLEPDGPQDAGDVRVTALTAAVDEPEDYSARHLSVLEGLEAVRKRPGMYIGSTDSRGLTHCMWEIIDNSVDEALGGFCTRIDVVLHSDGSVEVRDNGRGIPVDVEPRTGLSGVEVVMTKLHARGRFGSGSSYASSGLDGVGASVVNALSGRLDVEIDRQGGTHAMSFRRGIPGRFEGDGPDAPFTPGSGMEEVRRVAKKVTGARIRFWA